MLVRQVVRIINGRNLQQIPADHRSFIIRTTCQGNWFRPISNETSFGIVLGQSCVSDLCKEEEGISIVASALIASAAPTRNLFVGTFLFVLQAPRSANRITPITSRCKSPKVPKPQLQRSYGGKSRPFQTRKRRIPEGRLERDRLHSSTVFPIHPEYQFHNCCVLSCGHLPQSAPAVVVVVVVKKKAVSSGKAKPAFCPLAYGEPEPNLGRKIR